MQTTDATNPLAQACLALWRELRKPVIEGDPMDAGEALERVLDTNKLIRELHKLALGAGLPLGATLVSLSSNDWAASEDPTVTARRAERRQLAIAEVFNLKAMAINAPSPAARATHSPEDVRTWLAPEDEALLEQAHKMGAFGPYSLAKATSRPDGGKWDARFVAKRIDKWITWTVAVREPAAKKGEKDPFRLAHPLADEVLAIL